MTASRAEVLARLVEIADEMISDEESDIEYREVLDGRVAIRMRQQVREATTVWCTVGERTVTFEAYLLATPQVNAEAIFRQCLVRNHSTWLVHYAVDGEGGVVVRSRIDVEHLDAQRVSHVLAEVWDQVERAFPAMVRLAHPPREY